MNDLILAEMSETSGRFWLDGFGCQFYFLNLKTLKTKLNDLNDHYKIELVDGQGPLTKSAPPIDALANRLPRGAWVGFDWFNRIMLVADEL
jgi:hypothetical protein